jgi:hypothetical protein
MYNEFICLGKLVDGHTSYRREKEDAGTRYYLWSTVVAPRAMKGAILLGGMKSAALWINGHPIASGTTTVDLHAGPNPVLLRYDQPGTGYFLITEPNFQLPASIPGTLAMQWNTAKGILPFDLRPADPKPAGWYRFKAPPGTQTILLTAHGSVRCWINGQETPGKSQPPHDGANPASYRFDLPTPISRESIVALRIEQTRGLYAGAAVPEPISFECTQGAILAGDWSKLESLECYSGGLWYRKTLTLDPAQLKGPVTLDLGRVVSSAEVLVNGQSAGVRVAPPWRWDLTTVLKPGPNKLEILIYNTLANHYQTTPTRYRGNPTSGLLGPVTLQLYAAP